MHFGDGYTTKLLSYNEREAMIIKKNRSTTYVGTVDLTNEQDLKMVQTARNIVKEANRHMKISGNNKQLYIKLQGRGPRPSPRYWQSLPLSMAESADIYVYERHVW